MKVLWLALVMMVMYIGGKLLQELTHAPFMPCMVASGLIIAGGLMMVSAKDPGGQ